MKSTERIRNLFAKKLHGKTKSNISKSGKKEDKYRMKALLLILVFASLLITGCSTPTYDDGTPREYSDMPWGTPARWEGSIGVPGLNGYE